MKIDGEASSMIWRFITMFYVLMYILVTRCLAVGFFSNPQGSTALFASFLVKFAMNVILGIIFSHLLGLGWKNKYFLTILIVCLLIMSYMPVLYWTGLTANLSGPWNQGLIYVVNAREMVQCFIGFIFPPWRRSMKE